MNHPLCIESGDSANEALLETFLNVFLAQSDARCSRCPEGINGCSVVANSAKCATKRALAKMESLIRDYCALVMCSGELSQVEQDKRALADQEFKPVSPLIMVGQTGEFRIVMGKVKTETAIKD